MHQVHTDSSREPLFCAAERQRGHKQSEWRSRSAFRLLRSSFNSSHQQPAADALQGNVSPHASQVFCVGAVPRVCGPVMPELMLHRLFSFRDPR